MKLSLKRQGIGLIEILLVLAVVAIIAVTTTRYYQSANLNSQVLQAVQQVSTLAKTTYTYYQSTDPAKLNSKPIVDMLNTQLLDGASCIPAAAGFCGNPWGIDANATYICINSADGVSKPCSDSKTASDHFSIIMNNVPANACVQLVQRLQTSAPAITTTANNSTTTTPAATCGKASDNALSGAQQFVMQFPLY